jgi:type III restriction enzyme
MKLHFERDLPHQTQAIEAVCDLFHGQEVCRTEFTVTREALGLQAALPFAESSLGIGNKLTLLDEELLGNLQDVQTRNGIRPSEELASGDFTVEMETGTGKTYVYLRTIFELNRRYGFLKFVIVVPSVAIKEGVYKTLEMTRDHFREMYSGVSYEYFQYDSARLGQVRNFATATNIQIMVVTVGAINKKETNNLYRDSEQTGGEAPIDLIRATRPVLIVDEPQSVDGGLSGAGRTALNGMAPLAALRYSATHVDKHNMVYRLDAVDAYERKLVKQIEVASATVTHGHNRPFVRLVAVNNRRGAVTARVELDMHASGGAVVRKELTVEDGDQLEQITGRAVYADCRIGEIIARKNGEFLELRVPGDETFLRLGEAYGDVDPALMHREMIRRTIREHLEKERRLRPHGVKVLSLFFIDAVEKYRAYDEDGSASKGEYARIFEEEFQRLARHPDFRDLFVDVDVASTVESLHNGYFSVDKRGSWTDTVESNQPGREAAERAYNLIMKEKERLLSLDTPLKFIFSHSALREGWDNPNVFQICSLRDMRGERQRRQTIGRGLRLCVNQDGQRLQGFDINTLTVIATEDYEQFAERLQREIEEDTGIRFGVVEPHAFMTVTRAHEGGLEQLGLKRSEELHEHLVSKGYVNAGGRVQDALRGALQADSVELPEDLDPDASAQVVAILRKLAGTLQVRNADQREVVRAREAVLDSEEFSQLWDRIKHRSSFRLAFSPEDLIRHCTEAVKEMPPIAKTRLQWRSASLSIGEGGIETTESERGAGQVVVEDEGLLLPDVVTDLQDRTQMTRRSLVRILVDSGRLDDFKRNPQQFTTTVAEAINRRKRLAIIDGIKYERLGPEHVYAQQLFRDEELTGYLKNMLRETQKSVFEHVVYDSDTERTFAQELENTPGVKVYAKLPGWFEIGTPLGAYNPDWAVLVDDDAGERLYFVVETKGSMYGDDLRQLERAKMQCGKAHFEGIAEGESPASYVHATSVDGLFDAVVG